MGDRLTDQELFGLQLIAKLHEHLVQCRAERALFRQDLPLEGVVNNVARYGRHCDLLSVQHGGGDIVHFIIPVRRQVYNLGGRRRERGCFNGIKLRHPTHNLTCRVPCRVLGVAPSSSSCQPSSMLKSQRCLRLPRSIVTCAWAVENETAKGSCECKHMYIL